MSSAAGRNLASFPKTRHGLIPPFFEIHSRLEPQLFPDSLATDDDMLEILVQEPGTESGMPVRELKRKRCRGQRRADDEFGCSDPGRSSLQGITNGDHHLAHGV